MGTAGTADEDGTGRGRDQGEAPEEQERTHESARVGGMSGDLLLSDGTSTDPGVARGRMFSRWRPTSSAGRGIWSRD